MTDEACHPTLPKRPPRVPMLTTRLLYLLGCNYAVNQALGNQGNEALPHELAFIAAPMNADIDDFSEYIYNNADGWWMLYDIVNRKENKLGIAFGTPSSVPLSEMIERIDFASRMNGATTHNDAFRLGLLVGEIIGKMQLVNRRGGPVDGCEASTSVSENIVIGMTNLACRLQDDNSIVLFCESHRAVMRGVALFLISAAEGLWSARDEEDIPIDEGIDRYVTPSVMMAGTMCAALINEVSDFDFGLRVDGHVDITANLNPNQQAVFLNVANGEIQDERQRGLMCHAQILSDLRRLKNVMGMRINLTKHKSEEVAIITSFRDRLVPLSASNGHRSRFCGEFLNVWANTRHPLIHGGVVTSTMITDYLRVGVALCGIVNAVESASGDEDKIADIIARHYPLRI